MVDESEGVVAWIVGLPAPLSGHHGADRGGTKVVIELAAESRPALTARSRRTAPAQAP